MPTSQKVAQLVDMHISKRLAKISQQIKKINQKTSPRAEKHEEPKKRARQIRQALWKCRKYLQQEAYFQKRQKIKRKRQSHNATEKGILEKST